MLKIVIFRYLGELMSKEVTLLLQEHSKPSNKNHANHITTYTVTCS